MSSVFFGENAKSGNASKNFSKGEGEKKGRKQNGAPPDFQKKKGVSAGLGEGQFLDRWGG